MNRRSPPVCKRKGCDNPRERWQLACTTCWGDIPRADRNRYLRAARARLTRIRDAIGRELLRDLGRKPDAATASTAAYARTCAMLGERDEAEQA